MMADTWYYGASGSKQGPIDTTELRRLVGTGTIKPETLIWRSGLKEWVRADKVKGLFAAPVEEPPPLAQSLPAAPITQVAVVPPQPLMAAPGSTAAPTAPSPATKSPQGVPIPVVVPAPLLSVILLFSFWANGLVFFVLGYWGLGKGSFGSLIESLCAIISVGSPIAWLVFSFGDLFRFWTCVPDRFRITTPGKALGFIFIPFFNFYWVFTAFPGLSQCTNNALTDRGLHATAPVGLATALAIIFVCIHVGLVLFPPVSLLLCCAWAILWLLWIIRQCDATFTLLGRESPRSRLKGWVRGSCIAAAPSILSCLVLCVVMSQQFGVFLPSVFRGLGAVTSSESGGRTGSGGYANYNEYLSEQLQNARVAGAGEPLYWKGPPQSAKDASFRARLEQQSAYSRRLKDDLRKARDAFAPYNGR